MITQGKEIENMIIYQYCDLDHRIRMERGLGRGIFAPRAPFPKPQFEAPSPIPTTKQTLETQKKDIVVDNPLEAVIEPIVDNLFSGPTEKKPSYHSQFPPTKKVMEALGTIFTHQINVEGGENLWETRRQVANGKKIVYMLNHLSNLDTSTFERSMKLMGFDDLVNNLIYLQGIRLDRDIRTKVFLGAFKRIKVWPPTEIPQNEKEKHLCKQMTRDSLELSDQALESGLHLAIYAEGGRSYHGALKKVNPAIAHYLKLQPNTLVVPVAIYGTEKIMPVKNWFPKFGQPKASVSFCEPVSVDSLMEKYGGLKSSERNENVMNDIMKMIANRLPESYRGEYK